MGARPELARTWAVAGESLAGTGTRLLRMDGAACLARALEMLRELDLEWDAERVLQRTPTAAPAHATLRASGAPW